MKSFTHPICHFSSDSFFGHEKVTNRRMHILKIVCESSQKPLGGQILVVFKPLYKIMIMYSVFDDLAFCNSAISSLLLNME